MLEVVPIIVESNYPEGPSSKEAGEGPLLHFQQFVMLFMMQLIEQMNYHYSRQIQTNRK